MSQVCRFASAFSCPYPQTVQMSRVSFSGRELNTRLIILGSESQEARQSYAVSRDSEAFPLSLKYSFTSSIDLIYIQLRIIKCASCSLVAAKLKPAFAMSANESYGGRCIATHSATTFFSEKLSTFPFL